MAVKKREGERLDDESIEAVIELRSQAKPITIKEACERLNINPNGARLQKIIDEYHERKAIRKQFRDANRGKPATDAEIATVVEMFLVGESLKEIAETLYRSEGFVRKVIEDVGVPQVLPGEKYHNFSPLPEQCVAESFEEGEFVWSSKYGGIAEVIKFAHIEKGTGANLYRIWIHQRIDPEKAFPDGKRYKYQPETGGGYYAHQAAYDLGSLAHLRKYGVDVKRAIK